VAEACQGIGRLRPVVATVGCETRTTGVTQLPVPPNREQMAFTSAAPFNGPPAIATNECKQGRGTTAWGPATRYA